MIGRFLFWMDFAPPYMDRLADSCISHHADGGFYDGSEDMCIPRNVAEMAIACMETSDYKREGLLDTLVSIVGTIGSHRMDDGAFASDLSWRQAIGWCGASICGPAGKTPWRSYGNLGSGICAWMIGDYLG
ncbi:MAG: hypothetical protein QGH20_01865 [Candidatus Latescibacteria bacterium]|nr:hypothetical protein [Candidatus Latescibacterota bacterium]